MASNLLWNGKTEVQFKADVLYDLWLAKHLPIIRNELQPLGRLRDWLVKEAIQKQLPLGEDKSG